MSCVAGAGIFDVPASAPVMMSGCTIALTVASARRRSDALVPCSEYVPAVLRAKTEQCAAQANRASANLPVADVHTFAKTSPCGSRTAGNCRSR